MSAVELIRASITEEVFIDVLKRHGAKNLRREGDGYRSTCPIHGGDNDTAFSFNPNNMLFNCFTECGGGDCFDLIAMLNDIDIDKEFPRVVILTAEEFGISLEGIDIGDISKSYKTETMEYLRYINGKQEIFNNPYNLDNLGQKFAINNYRGIGKNVLSSLNVTFCKDLNRICFPILDIKNNIIGASLRAVGEEKPKWLHRPRSIKTGRVLYNLKNVIDKGYREVFVVEGIMDCINLVNQGIENVVCTFGARITDEQKMILISYFDEVVLFFDNDKAGIEATKKAIEKLHKIITTKYVKYKSKDPGMIDLKTESIEIKDWYNYD